MLKVNTKSLNLAILRSAKSEINKRLKSRLPQIQDKVRTTFGEILRKDETIVELSLGLSDLSKQLGKPFGQSVDPVIQQWVDALSVSIKMPVELRGSRGLKFNLQIEAPIEELQTANVQSSSVHGGVWNWLRPILDKDGTFVVSGFFYRPANSWELKSKVSRGGGIMNKKESGSMWTLDDTHSRFLERISSKDNAELLMSAAVKEIMR